VTDKSMGSPAQPTADQFKQLQKAGQLAESTATPAALEVKNRTATIAVNATRPEGIGSTNHP